MGGGLDDPVVPSWIEPSGALEGAPADRFASDSVAHDTLEVPVVTELDGASSQSPRLVKNDAVGIESHENTEVDDTKNDAATVTGKEQDFANFVATKVQTVKADKQNPQLDPETMFKQPETHPISQEQLEAEVKGIYAGLVMVEGRCIEVDDGQMPPTDGPLDVTKYLLMIPDAKLILLQDGGMRPEGTVRTWYIKVQKDATKGDKKPSTPESTKNLPATSQDLSATPGDSSTTPGSPSTTIKDCPTTPEKNSARPPAYCDVSEKTAPQVGSPEDYLRAFQVALELRAKEHGWPECEQLAAVNAAEIGKEDRKKVMDGKYYLSIGYDLVDQLLRDLETAKTKAAEKEAGAKAKADQEAAQAKAEEEAPRAKEDKKDSNPDPEATSARMDETPDNPEAQSMLSNGTQQAASQETSAEESKAALEEEAFEETAPQKADAALEDAATQQNAAQDASLSTREPQASAEEVGSAPRDSGKETVDAVALDEKTRSESEKKPETKRSILVDLRPLDDKNRYRKVGREWWVLISGRWIPSLSGEQYAAVFALHRACLHEHHDFFLASQHPNASRALRRLAQKYAMPARMWKHAIHSCLEVLRRRLPESREIMDCFITMAYGMMALLDETVPRFRSDWIECKADLARYGMVIEDKDMKVEKRWRDAAREEYTRVVVDDPTVGRLYHHLAILVRARSPSPDANFDANVSKLFYYTKSLVVKTPFYAARGSVLTVVKPIVDRNKKAAEKPAGVPQTDQDHFLTAVVHLILASLEPETLRENGYKDSRKDHVQAVYAALEKIKVGGPVETPRIRPSAQVGLLLCQLLLGIPLVDKRRSPMMAAWAPDLVTAEDRADSDAMANARDIHDATIELISTMVPYLLEDADTRDLRVWEFIYVILVFMRSLKTRPALLKRLGSAFHAEMIAPYLNMLLREDETRGRHAFESASRSELVTVCSPLNERTKLGKYGLSTEDNVRKYHCEQEKKRKAESAESTATTGTTTSDAAHEMGGNTKTPGSEQLYANVLPEHFLLSGLPFAKEADPEPRDEPLENPTEDAVAGACPAAPEATPAAVQTAEEPAVKQAQEASPAGEEREERKAKEEEERKRREAKEAEVRKQEGLLRDPPLFPNGWLKKSKYDFDEMRVCDYVQSFETYNDRSNQILRLAVQLSGDFFIFKSDEEKRIWISVSGASSVPKPDLGKKMPEIVERDGGVRVVYVDPSSHAAEIKKEKNAEATAKVTTVVSEKAKGDAEEVSAVDGIPETSQLTGTIEQQPTQSERPTDHVNAGGAPEAVNIPAGAPGTVSEDGDDTAIPAYDMAQRKAARAVKAITAAEKPSSTHDTEPIEAEAEETTLPAAASADDPQASAELTKDVLDKMPKVERPASAIKRWRAPIKTPGADKDEDKDVDEDVDEDGWTHVSDESYRDAETIQTAQVETRSMIWRLFF